MERLGLRKVEQVWLQLEEKRVPYVIEKINMRCYGDKPMSYLKKTSSGLLPALEIDGNFYTESEFIMFKVGAQEKPPVTLRISP